MSIKKISIAASRMSCCDLCQIHMRDSFGHIAEISNYFAIAHLSARPIRNADSETICSNNSVRPTLDVQ